MQGGSAALPTGVVTFVLTDIEDSTQLWETSPEDMAVALERHDKLIERIVVDHQGVLLKSKGEGDSTLSAFRRATAAASAATALNECLEAQEWPGRLCLRVRIGLHTGEAYERDGDYYGPALNRAARIRGLAHGGQVVASAATAELVQDRLPSGSALVSLGERPLRGLRRAERIFLLADAETAATRAAESLQTGHSDVPLPRRVTRASVGSELFVGRDAELGLLTEALKAGREEGRPRLALVDGEPGMGKTSLAATFAHLAHDQGATVLYGAGDEDLASPHQPWREVLAHLVDHAPAHLGPVLHEHAGHLTTLGIGSASPTSGSADPDTGRYLLYGAVIEVLAAAAEPSSLVVILEDLHWADASSLQLLRHLLATSPSAKLMVVGTFRGANATAGSPLAGLLASLHRETGVVRIPLDGLGEAELLSLLEAAAGRPLREPEMALRDALLAETDGNPFFVVELLRHLAETGAIYQESSGDWAANHELDMHGLPRSVREVIRERVARLGAQSANALSAASVIGRDFELGVLAAAANTDKGQVLDALEIAGSASLVTDLGQERFSFAHALIGRALYDQMSPTRRAMAHGSVARALEETHGEDPDHAAELAVHFSRTTTPDHDAKALLYAQRAADHALARLAPADARRWYAEALAHLECQPEADEGLDCELRIGLGDAQRQCGDAAHRQTLLDAGRQAMGLGRNDLLVRAALANSRGWFSIAGGVDGERIEMLRAACRAVEGTRSAHEARLLAALASELTFASDYLEHRAIADRALALARELGDATTLLNVLNYRSPTITAPSTVEERLAETAEAAELADAVNDPIMQLATAIIRHQVAWEAADRVEIDRLWQAIQELRHRPLEPIFESIMQALAANRATVAGDFDEAERLASEMLAIGMKSGQQDAARWSMVLMLDIRREQGRVAEVIPQLEAFLEQMPERTGIRVWLARCLCDAGRLERARDLLAGDVANEFSDLPWDFQWLPTACYAADAIAELAWSEAAEPLLARLHPYADQFATNGGSCAGPVARSVARLLVTTGNIDEAERFLTASERICHAMQSPLFLAHTHLDWGRALVGSGRPGGWEHGKRHLAQALGFAAKHGFTLIEQKAHQALAE